MQDQGREASSCNGRMPVDCRFRMPAPFLWPTARVSLGTFRRRMGGPNSTARVALLVPLMESDEPVKRELLRATCPPAEDASGLRGWLKPDSGQASGSAN